MSDEYRCMRFLWALSVFSWAACTEPNPASCLDNFCSDPALPFCDVDGSIEGVPNTCIAVACTANEFKECQADRALVCNETGDSFELVDCEFGCGDDGCLPCNTTDCEQHLVPKYLPTICDGVVSTEFAVAADLAINTSDDANCTSIVAQPTGPEICVIHHDSITIEENRTLRVTGTRAIAMVADHRFVLGGLLDASGDGQLTNGPGGGFKKSGGGQGAGGGAGNRTRGGDGGNATTAGGALNGGAPEPNPATLSELFGGPQINKANPGAFPGASGGAVTLICCRCTLSVMGTIDVGGGGGSQGATSGTVTMVLNPPGGGGSGGNVVLQGLQVEVEGQLFSNGGGGGGGGNGFGDLGTAGENGPRSTMCAAGGTSQMGGIGGRGGCVTDPFDGSAAPNGRAGAGGGSTGFLLTYTPEGVVPILNPFAVSPMFEPNGVVGTN